MNTDPLTLDPVTPSSETIKPRKNIAKKIAALIVVIILLVAFGLMVYVLTTKRNPFQNAFPKNPEPDVLTANYCNSLPETERDPTFGDNGFPRDQCFMKLARQEGDYEYCNQEDEGSRNACLSFVAAKLEDTEFCESVEPLYRNGCYGTIAQESKKTKYCQELDSAYRRDSCINTVAIILEDINTCEEMEDKSLGSKYVDCISFIALRYNECSILQQEPYDIEDEVIESSYDICVDRKRLEDLSKSLN